MMSPSLCVLQDLIGKEAVWAQSHPDVPSEQLLISCRDMVISDSMVLWLRAVVAHHMTANTALPDRESVQAEFVAAGVDW